MTAALSLHAAGIDALVIDSVSELRPLGVGINLLPHATRELIELGLGDALAELAIPTAEAIHLDRHGNRIWGTPRGLAAGYRWPQYSIHRGELQAALLAAVRDRLGAASVRTGLRFESFTQNTTEITGRVSDSVTGVHTVLSADAVIGADGLNSAVRAQLHPHEGRPLWNGIRMWRGIAEAAPFLTGRSMILAGTNSAARLVVYPISRAAERRGRALVNWVAEVRVADTRHPTPDWNHAGQLADVLAHYAGWRFDGVEVAALMSASEQILEYPMVDRDPLPYWGSGRVTLLGDAAHPMYPIGSNGASQAILDGRVLARELDAADDPIAGLAAYEAARRETVNAIVLANRDIPMDAVLNTVAERAPEGFDRIEDVLSAAELAAIAAGYDRTTGTDAEALNNRPSLSPPKRQHAE
ncbi:flavin-dependent oxidoreductase [Nocardia callitridis]|uniref:Flavin-dependent oxidoreductase n=1 Tax=Nocardia callitridis TaxID=648753 RepID=A0ABP9JUD7_9NOCA